MILDIGFSDLLLYEISSKKRKRKVTVNKPDAPGEAALNAAIQDALTQRFGTPSAEPLRFDTTKKVEGFVKDFDFSLVIPGQHYSGLSNQELLELFTAHNREFGADTQALRESVKKRLLGAFTAGSWDESTAATLAADAIREWIIDRVNSQGVDISLKPLSPRYLRSKVSAGYDSRIGIRKGRWIKSLSKMRVLIK